MSKFAKSLDGLLKIKVYAKDMIDLTFVTDETLRNARRGKTNIRRSTAVLFLAAARKIVERKKRELDEALAAMEKAYAEEFKGGE
jgi:hypothetical protein